MLRFIPVFVTTFFLSLNFGSLIYVNSTYLGNFFGPNLVSALFIVGAIGNAALFFSMPWALRIFGKKRLLFITLLILLASTLGLNFSSTAFAIASAFAIYSSFLFIAYFVLDIFLEKESTDGYTGEIRGLYFSTMNAGIALGPMLLSILDIGDELKRIYLVGAMLLIIPFLISIWILLTRKHSHISHTAYSPRLPFGVWWRHRSLRAVTFAKLTLEIFFAIMVIYTPIYLHGVMGFEWSELGIIFTVMLLPFVFLEWPAGELADRLWGEKEMMTAGFFISGAMLLIMPFMDKTFFGWMAILFASRVGAALIEIMTESYFFKKIDAGDAGLISIFRLARPVGIIAGSVIGAASLAVFSVEKVFFVLAAVILFGMLEALHVRDTL